MAYIKSFGINRRNSRFCGPNESNKIRAELAEAVSNLKTIHTEVSSLKGSIDAIANSSLLPSGSQHSLNDLRKSVATLEDSIVNKIHIKTN
jgi:hypothetical protein